MFQALIAAIRTAILEGRREWYRVRRMQRIPQDPSIPF